MSNFQLAHKTLILLENAVANDCGNRYRRNLQIVLPHITDAYLQVENGFRTHLGASVIGTACGRAIWYGFRWFKNPTFSGRIYRLFNRGHLEEGRVIALLLSAGIQVYQQDKNGKQFTISYHDGHFGGSGDGVIVGIPDLPINEPALLEIKTHSSKSFAELEKKGVKDAKFEHYVQMQMYMAGMNLKYGVYIAVNKDNDALHIELILPSSFVAYEFIDRAKKLIWSLTPPKKINENPTWYQCKFCDFSRICHYNEEPLKNCRTCQWSKPGADKKWICTVAGTEVVIDKETQEKGCGNHTAIAD